nr:hypothetical protein GCM10020092_073690 [Actinoplanes digitatis]
MRQNALGTLSQPSHDALQLGAVGRSLQRGDDPAAQLKLLPHALNLHTGAGHAPVQRLGRVRAGQFADRLQRPEGVDGPLARAHPPGRVPDLPALRGQTRPQQRRAFHLGGGVGSADGRVERHRPPLGPVAPRPVGGDLPEGRCGEPGPEARGVAQAGQPLEGTQHDVLHDVVDIRITGHGLPHEAVDERQLEPGQLAHRAAAAGARRGDDSDFLGAR